MIEHSAWAVLASAAPQRWSFVERFHPAHVAEACERSRESGRPVSLGEIGGAA